MKCPSCGALDSRVLDSRPVEDGSSIKRRRECTACNKRFTTYETVETLPLMVIKKDGSRQIFEEHKLRSGVLKACQKRPVDVDALVNDVVQDLHNRMLSEISAEELGELVMHKLREIDAVSYVRFASVYKEFRDVDSFMDELAKIVKRSGGKKL